MSNRGDTELWLYARGEGPPGEEDPSEVIRATVRLGSTREVGGEAEGRPITHD